MKVHSLFDTSQAVQMIELKGGQQLITVQDTPVPLLLLACSTKILALEVMPYDAQIRELVSEKRVDLAIDLLQQTTRFSRIEDKTAKLQAIHLQAGFVYVEVREL